MDVTTSWQPAEALVSPETESSIYSRTRGVAATSDAPLLNGRDTSQHQPQAGTSKGHDHQLYWWDELPQVLQYNKYIRSGYRAGFSRQECLCSVLQYHNETGNIHVHLLPALILLLLLATGMLPVWAQARLAFWESVLPVLMCLSGSVCYHTLMANHWHYKKYLVVDVCGVFLVLVCGSGSGIYWGLRCYPLLCNCFLAAYYTTAVFCIISGVQAKTPIGRAGPMLGLLGVRGGALIARIILQTGEQAAVRHYLVAEAAGMAGALINIARVPEKWLFDKEGPHPKCRKASFLDYWLNSHQLMHILVLFGMIFKFLGTSADYNYRFEQQMGCQ